jgi:hypothetical protein
MLAALPLLLFPLLLVLAIASLLSQNVPDAAVKPSIATVDVHGVLAVFCFPALLPMSLLLLLTSQIYLAALILLASCLGRVPAASVVSFATGFSLL